MADGNVYDEISALLDREEASIDSAVEGYDERLKAAIQIAQGEHDQAVDALSTRKAQLETVRETVRGLVEQAEEELPPLDPQAPTAPAEPADPASSPSEATSSSESSPAIPTPEEPEIDSEPSSEELPSELETSTPLDEPSTPTGEDSPQPEPTESEPLIQVTPAGAATAVSANLAAHVEPETPVVMTSPSTGETLQVTAADVLAANDSSIADDDLPEAAKPIRNSDFL
jgi:hypothetical protein